MATVICELQIRNDTAANWTASNPTLLAGELGFETDTKFYKWGDGSTAWNSLTYDVLFGGDIAVAGLVDGIDIAGLSGAYTSHAADATLHFTEASINHTAIANIGTNTHAQIDSHIGDATLHFTQAAISITESQISDLQTYVPVPTPTTVATTTGTGAKDLSTTIPSWATEITLSLFNFSTSGTVVPLIQVGNTTFVTTGYLGTARRISGTAVLHSTGFAFGNSWAAAYVAHGVIKLVKQDSTADVWSVEASLSRSGTAMSWIFSGAIDLTSALDRVRITIGADTYDGGSIGISYR